MDQQPSDQPPPYEPLEDGLHIPVDTKMDAFGLDLESEEQVQRFVMLHQNIYPLKHAVNHEYIALLKHALKHATLYGSVVDVLRSLLAAHPKEVAAQNVLHSVVYQFSCHPSPHPSFIKSAIVDFLEQQASSTCAPTMTRTIYDFLINAINHKNGIPPELAERCLLILGRNYENHQFLIAHGGVEFLLSQLSLKWDSPIGEDYVTTLHNMAYHHTIVQEKCGKEGVFVALRMMRKCSVPATEFLVTLMSSASNREVMRTSNGVNIVFAFTKKTHAFSGVLALSTLAQEDGSVINSIFHELTEMLAEIIKVGQISQQRSIVFTWIENSVTDRAALGKLADCGVIEAVARLQWVNSIPALAVLAKISGAYSYWNHSTPALHFVLAHLPGFIPRIINLIASVDTRPIEAGFALSVLASLFASARDGKQELSDTFTPLLPRTFPALLTFLKNVRQVTDAVVVLYGIKYNARCSDPLPDLIPYLSTILSHTKVATDDPLPSTSAIGLLHILSYTPSNIPALQEDAVITFIQHVQSAEICSPSMDGLINRISSTLYLKQMPILVNFLVKDGVQTSRYVPALVDGHAARSIIRQLQRQNQLLTSFHAELITFLRRISFFAAEEIVESGGVLCLIRLAIGPMHMIKALDVKEMIAVLWMLIELLWIVSMRRRSRRLLTAADRSAIINFVTGLNLSPLDSNTHHLRDAILFNLHSSDEGDSDDDMAEPTSISSHEQNSTTPKNTPDQRPSQPTTPHNKSKKKKKKKANQSHSRPTRTSVDQTLPPKLVGLLNAMCERASRELLQQREGMKDNLENILIFFKHLFEDILEGFKADSCCVMILNIWLYGSVKQATIAMELLTAVVQRLPYEGQRAISLLSDFVPAVKKYIQEGRGISPLSPAAQKSMLETFTFWESHKTAPPPPTDSAELKKLKETIEAQKQEITSLQQINTQFKQAAELQKLKDQELEKLRSDLEEMHLTIKSQPKNMKTILESCNVEAIESLEEFDEFYIHLKAKVKVAKQRKAKLKQERDDRAKTALLCPICQDNRFTLTCNPCGHSFCKLCTDTMFSGSNNKEKKEKEKKKCPICRTAVSSTITLYF